MQEEAAMDVEQFEPILSDEEIVDESDAQFQDMEYDFNDEEENSKAFNPFTCDLQPLSFLSDPSVSPCEAEENRLHRATVPLGSAACEDAARLEELLAAYSKATGTGGDFQEDWVHLAEQAPPLLAKALPLVSDKDDVTSALLNWVKLGLDFDAALSQPQPGYKVRHLKAGIRLAEALCQCGERYTRQLLDVVDIHARLLHLYRRDYMALSIKLMILKALDTSLNCRYAVERFLCLRTPGQSSDVADGDTGYRTLLAMALDNQLARVKFAMGSIMRKVHVYEVLGRLNAGVKQVVEEAETDVLDTIIECLEEITRVYKDAPLLLAQPKRFLPASAQFEIGASLHDPYPALYAFFRCHKLLEILLVLLSCPQTSNYSTVICPVQDLLRTLLDTPYGMQYFMSNVEVTTMIIRLLLSSSVSEEVLDETSASTPLQQIGLCMAYRLQALQYIDTLLELQSQARHVDPDSSQVLETLHGLYCLGYTPAGRAALIHVVSRGDNVKALLRFFAQPDSHTPKGNKSPGKGYAADLILLAVKFSTHVPFLQRFGKDILSAALREEKMFSSRLHEAVPWLKLLDSPAVFSYDDITTLCEAVARSAENATALPGELITALRILKHLGVRSEDSELATVDDEYHQLKHKYVILRLFSCDGITTMTTILQRLCDAYDQPSLHATSFLGSHGSLLVSLVLPAVQLVRRMVTHVVRCRNTQYKDLTAVPALLRTYSLMHAFPATAWAFVDAQRACREIVETLLAYTQPITPEASTETDPLHKSLWTLMMAEVVRYVTTGPHTFVPGLLMMSELLPLPLPVQTRAALPDVEALRTVNARKLWSAHLHALAAPLQDMIATMCGSSFQPLLQLLRRVCVQLADLATPTATIVARAVLDPILAALAAQPNGNGGPFDAHAARLLNFLGCLLTHPAVKAAVLFLVSNGSSAKGDERYPSLVAATCGVLRRASDAPAHVQAQECVVAVVQALCDIEVSLVPPPAALAEPHTHETYLANSLPPRELLVTFCGALLEHVSNIEHGATTLLSTVRTFLLLSYHDYGFYHLKSCLDKNPPALRNLFLKFYTGFSAVNNTLHIALNTSLELLRVFITAEVYDEALPPRTLAMTVPELARVLDWARPDEGEEGKGERHPLLGLEKLLRECSGEEESLESLQESVSCLIQLLEDEGNKPADVKEWAEPTVASPSTLLAQFSARPVFVLGDVEEERLSTSYWLAPPPVDDIDQDVDQVPCDLLDLSRELLPELELSMEAEHLCRLKSVIPHEDADDVDLIKKRGDDAKFLAAETRNKRPFVAPMRGRGFGRATPQRGDLFRSRPPNTSRPPSLHVDDFVALEISGQQPTGPTGYNKLSMRAAKDMMCVRARGRGRAFPSERGRFFGVTTTYRRENGRGCPPRGTSMTRGGSNGRGGPPMPSWEANNSQASPQRTFRSPEARDNRMTPRSDDKFTQHFVGGRGGGVRPPSWPIKDHRERFGGPNNRGGLRREPVRHTRTFTR